jgi:hypothetical protein
MDWFRVCRRFIRKHLNGGFSVLEGFKQLLCPMPEIGQGFEDCRDKVSEDDTSHYRPGVRPQRIAGAL